MRKSHKRDALLVDWKVVRSDPMPLRRLRLWLAYRLHWKITCSLVCMCGCDLSACVLGLWTQGHMVLSPAFGLKLIEYVASKQWPRAMQKMDDTMPLDLVAIAARMAGGGWLSEGGEHAAWDGLLEGVYASQYSFHIFCVRFMCSSGFVATRVSRSASSVRTSWVFGAPRQVLW